MELSRLPAHGYSRQISHDVNRVIGPSESSRILPTLLIQNNFHTTYDGSADKDPVGSAAVIALLLSAKHRGITFAHLSRNTLGFAISNTGKGRRIPGRPTAR